MGTHTHTQHAHANGQGHSMFMSTHPHTHAHENEGHMAEEITMKWEERKGGKTGEGRGEKMEN